MRRLLTVAAIPLCAIALSSCELLGLGGARDDMPAPAVPEEQPPEVEQVREAVSSLLEGESHPSSDEIFSTLEDAGYEPDRLEATIDASPLENEVPSKVFAVRTDQGCIVGEIRAGDLTLLMQRSVESVEVCLFGDVDRPEGVEAPEGDPRTDGEDGGAGHLPDESIETSEEPPPGGDGGGGLGGN